MSQLIPIPDALCRLLAATWDPQAAPSPQSVAWTDLLRVAGLSSIAGNLYAVTREMRGSMPPEVRETLEQAYYRTIAANTLCLRQLADVREGLAAVGAPLLLLKGAALSQTLYGDHALRLIGDIDLAVPLEAVAECRRALREMGYRAGQVEEQPGSRLAHSNQELFLPPAPHGTTVELHWHILDVPYYLQKVPMAWFWQHTERLAVAGGEFQVLDPEANLIYLPAHLALHHRFRGWHSLLDLALLIRENQDRIAWDRVAVTAQGFELLCVLRATVERLSRCWPALPLGEARRALLAATPSRNDARLYRLLTAESRNNVLDWYTTLISLPGLGDRARFVRTYAFPDAAYMKHRYGFAPGWQLPYWYLHRLAGGLGRLARTLPRARRLDRGGP